MTINSAIGERALREIYLPPFEAVVREGDAWGMMAAYNRLNGGFCTENRISSSRILKDEWGFRGLVVSDWLATHSTVAAARAGLDLEMPGPPIHFGDEARGGRARRGGHGGARRGQGAADPPHGGLDRSLREPMTGPERAVDPPSTGRSRAKPRSRLRCCSATRRGAAARPPKSPHSRGDRAECRRGPDHGWGQRERRRTTGGLRSRRCAIASGRRSRSSTSRAASSIAISPARARPVDARR